jgi:Fe-S cluster biogenesis protein NfuA
MMREKVEALETDGGDAELVDVKSGVVTVRLTGACGSCPMSTLTLKKGVERVIRAEIPEIKEVVASRRSSGLLPATAFGTPGKCGSLKEQKRHFAQSGWSVAGRTPRS